MGACARWSRAVGGWLVISILVLTAVAGEAAELTAGTAKAVITPDLDTSRALVTGGMSDGLDHDIYARALVLNDGTKRLVIVTYDLNCLDVATPILRVRCRDELGIDPAYLVLLATHNHEAPIQIAPTNFDYGRWLADRIFDLIKEAIGKEQGPARLLFGYGYGYFLANVGNVPADYEIQLLKVMRGDEVVAMLFNQPTHPLQGSETKIGVGHPGYALDEVEKRVPGALAMYADAFGANQGTVEGLLAPLETVQSVGKRLADCVLEIAEGPLQDVTGPISSRLEVISLPLAPPISYEEARKLAEKIPRDIGFVPCPNPDRGTNWIRSLLKHHEEKIPFPTTTTDRVCTDDGFLVREYETPREFPCRYEETIVSTIGPMVFVAMQGEVCAPIGMQIKDAFRRYDIPIMVFAYMGEHNLYIPTRELVRVGAYQARVIQTQYGSPVGWAPEVEEEMVAGVIRMIGSMLPESRLAGWQRPLAMTCPDCGAPFMAEVFRDGQLVLRCGLPGCSFEEAVGD